MKDSLSRISNLLIITAVFLYFTAWVYMHFYFERFGLTTGSLKIDYATYLVYSYNVFFSFQFLYILLPLIVLWLLIQILLYRDNKYKDTTMSRRLRVIRVTISRNQFGLLLLLMLIAFPLLFFCARAVALSDYQRDREGDTYLKKVQFIFNKDAEWLSSSDTVAILPPGHGRFKNDISVLKYDTTGILRLLAESDEYFFVLRQGPYNTTLHSFPEGYVFLVNKKDVLLAKIVLP
jgi:hypothetical protein